jgi:hypothetical protein
MLSTSSGKCVAGCLDGPDGAGPTLTLPLGPGVQSVLSYAEFGDCCARSVS